MSFNSPSTLSEIMRCKAITSRLGRTSRVLESETVAELATRRVDGCWSETWIFSGDNAYADAEQWFESINWQGRPPEITCNENGSFSIAHVRTDKAQKPTNSMAMQAISRQEEPIAERPVFAPNPNFTPDESSVDEDEYASYRDN